LFMLPIIYNYIVGFSYQVENSTLEVKEANLNAIVSDYKQKLNAKRKELKALKEANDKLAKVYNRKRGELDKVYNKKFHYQLKSEQLALVTEVLNGYDLKSRNITITDNQYFIELEAKDNKEITAFIKQLVRKFDNKIDDVNIDNIKLDKKDKLYKGVLKVEFSRGE